MVLLPLMPPLRALILLLFAPLLLACLSGCEPGPQPQQLQRIMDSGVLVVGTRYGATTYYQGATEEQGFEYELAAGFADYLGVELAMVPFYSTSQMLDDLETRQLDFVAAGLVVTPQRQQRFAFGPSYMRISQKLVFKQGNTWPRSLADIDQPLLVVAGSSHAQQLAEVSKDYPNLNWQETDEVDDEEMLQQVLDGALPYAIADSNILAVMRRRNPELSVGFTLSRPQPMAWLLNPQEDDSLLGAMLDYFSDMHSSGRLQAMEDKYFGHVRQFNYVDTRMFIAAAKRVLPRYQHWFEAYSGEVDWRLLAAMAYQESHWDPKARSRTGVRGMMMLTLATARDMGIQSRLDPEQSIRGGAQYFANLLSRIPARIQAPDRIWFALAAYNIGLGHLEDARVLTQRQGGNPDIWIDVKQRLPQLRQKKYYKTTRYGYARGDEAVSYVDNIRRYYDTLVWLDEQRKLADEQGLESTP